MDIENKTTTEVPEEEAKKPEVDISSLQAEIERLKDANEKLKQANTKASADTSKYKKELQARQTETERAEAERKEELENLRSENASLKREGTIRSYANSLLAMGYSEELANKKATCIADGDNDGALAIDKEFISEMEKKMKSDAIIGMKRPPVGGANNTASVSKEEFKRMSYTERLKLKEENEELYNKLI